MHVLVSKKDWKQWLYFIQNLLGSSHLRLCVGRRSLTPHTDTRTPSQAIKPEEKMKSIFHEILHQWPVLYSFNNCWSLIFSLFCLVYFVNTSSFSWLLNFCDQVCNLRCVSLTISDLFCEFRPSKNRLSQWQNFQGEKVLHLHSLLFLYSESYLISSQISVCFHGFLSIVRGCCSVLIICSSLQLWCDQ